MVVMLAPAAPDAGALASWASAGTAVPASSRAASPTVQDRTPGRIGRSVMDMYLLLDGRVPADGGLPSTVERGVSCDGVRGQGPEEQPSTVLAQHLRRHGFRETAHANLRELDRQMMERGVGAEQHPSGTDPLDRLADLGM